MHFTIRRTGRVLPIDLRGAPDHFMGRPKSTIKVPTQRAMCTVSTMRALSSLGAFYDFDERNKKPFKGTERVINQRTALQTAACYTDGPGIVYHLPDDLGLFAVFYLWRSQPCHLCPLVPRRSAITVKCRDINLLQLTMTVEGNQGPFPRRVCLV